MKKSAFDSIPDVVAAIRRGKMVIVTDDADRENEGDLIMAAAKITPHAVNFMAKHARGLICTPVTEERAQQLGLQRMVAQYRDLGLLKTETLSQTAESFLKEYPLTPPGGENALTDCKDTFAPATGWMVKNVKEFVDNNLKDQPAVNAKIVENLPKVMNWDVPRKATWYSSR